MTRCSSSSASSSRFSLGSASATRCHSASESMSLRFESQTPYCTQHAILILLSQFRQLADSSPFFASRARKCPFHDTFPPIQAHDHSGVARPVLRNGHIITAQPCRNQKHGHNRANDIAKRDLIHLPI